MIFLVRGAVVDQEFRGPERVGHHYGDGERHGTGRQLADDGAVRGRGESKPPEFLRDDDTVEPVLLEVIPEFRRQIPVPVDLPVIGQAARGFRGAAEKCPFFFAQFGIGFAVQTSEIGFAGEEVAVNPYASGFDGGLFGRRDGWKEAEGLKDSEDPGGDQYAAERPEVEEQRDDAEAPTEAAGRTECPKNRG